MNDPRVSYEQHLEFLRMVCSGATMELAGFVDAEYVRQPSLPDEPRYMQGFRDGKAKIETQQVTA